MKNFTLGSINGICMFLSFGFWVCKDYIISIIFMIITILLISIAFQLPEYLRLKREAKEIESIIKTGRNKINNGF